MKSKKSTLLFTSIGAGLEYYDFVIYGLLAGYIAQVFFPSTNSITEILQAFAVFAMGYLARPLGGLFFGHLGDRIGRKSTFLLALIMTAVATFGIGLLPSYEQVGLLAVILLILFRLAQGFAFGAAIPGTITFLVEHAGKGNSSKFSSTAIAGTSLGVMFGSLLILLLTKTLTHDQMLSFGWRIPFFLGGVLALFGYWIRTKTEETPVFIEYAKTAVHKIPLLELIRSYPWHIMLGLGISLLAACFVVFAVGLPAFLQRFYSYDAENIYLAITLSLLWSAITLPIFGWIADRIGYTRLILVGSLLTLAGTYYLFELLTLGTLTALIMFMFIYETLLSMLFSTFLPLLALLFPAPVRFSGVALCYNIVFCCAGLTPLVLTELANSLGILSVVIFFAVLAAITAMCTIIITRQKMLTTLEN